MTIREFETEERPPLESLLERRDLLTLLLQTQDEFTAATSRFWRSRGLRSGHLPVTTGAVSSPMGRGSDSRPVRVEIDGEPTYLADSMQFALEYVMRLSPEGSYYVMPSFRAEPADATHLPQFFHSEVELPGGLADAMSAAEAYLRSVTADLAAVLGDVIPRSRIRRLLDDERPFDALTFDEAVDLVGGVEGAIETAPDGSWRTLTRLGEQEIRRRLGDFVWVTHWDHLAVPFYQAFGTDDVALNADLIAGPGEILGAGERHHHVDDLARALALHEVDAGAYEWYVDLRKVAPMRTSGFGLGIERYLMWLLGREDIRDLQLLERDRPTWTGP